MTKILFISDGPHISTGYGKITKYLGFQLAENGFDVAYASAAHHGEKCTYTYGGHTHDLYSVVVPYRGCPTIVDRTMEAAKPDIVIFIRDAVGLSTARLDSGINLASLKGKIKRISYIPLMYTSMVPDIVEAAISSSDAIVPFTDYSRIVFTEYGVPYNMLSETIPPGYDGNVYKKMPKSPNYFGEKENVFGFIGAINNTRKNLQALFKAFSLYIQAYDPGALLYLHYSPVSAYDISMMQQIYGLKDHLLFPKNYTFEWGMDEAEMAQIYNSLKAVVSASGTEGFNMPFLEAMACGIPAVGVNIPFYDWSNQILKANAYEGVESTTSLSYAVDTQSLADKMHESLKHKIKTDEISHMEWKEVGRKWIKLLESL